MSTRRVLTPRVNVLSLNGNDVQLRNTVKVGEIYRLSNGFWYVRNPLCERDPVFSSRADALSYHNTMLRWAKILLSIQKNRTVVQ